MIDFFFWLLVLCFTVLFSWAAWETVQLQKEVRTAIEVILGSEDDDEE